MNLPTGEAVIVTVQLQAMHRIEAGFASHYGERLDIFPAHCGLGHVFEPGSGEVKIRLSFVQRLESLCQRRLTGALRNEAQCTDDELCTLVFRILFLKVAHPTAEFIRLWSYLVQCWSYLRRIVRQFAKRFEVKTRTADKIEFVEGQPVDFLFQLGCLDEHGLEMMADGDKASARYEYAPYLGQGLFDRAVLEAELRRHKIKRIIIERLHLARRAAVELDCLARLRRRVVADDLRMYVGKVSCSDKKAFVFFDSNPCGNRRYSAVTGSNIEYAGAARQLAKLLLPEFANDAVVVVGLACAEGRYETLFPESRPLPQVASLRVDASVLASVTKARL